MAKDRDQVAHSTVLQGRKATQTDADARRALLRIGRANRLLVRTFDLLLRPLNTQRLAFLLSLVAITLAVGRIVSTYGVFGQIWDEPAHVACGMEWLNNGTYTYEALHPPLARVAVAIGPYLSGIRLSGQYPHNMWKEGNEIFQARGQYFRNLALARLGVIPFFILSAIVVWVWARTLLGEWVALAAVALYTTLPAILGWGGAAYTDVPITATFPLALFSLVRWLENPTSRRSVILGLAVGAAVLTKFSVILFLPACAIAVFLCRRAMPIPRSNVVSSSIRNWIKHWALVLGACAVLIWGGYRFA